MDQSVAPQVALRRVGLERSRDSRDSRGSRESREAHDA